MSNSSFSLSSISFDNGFVEITALTTLISSSAAASLALGSRGPSGLAWAATSAFGIIAVVKACLSAAAPGWLRETIGVRSSASDLAVGLPLDLGSDSSNSRRVRKTLDRPIAIQCRGDIGDKGHPSRNNIGSDIYAYDFSTLAMIGSVPDTEPGEPTRIFTYGYYAFRRVHPKRVQIGAICLSFLKLTESYALWRNNSNLLALVTSIPWCQFFIFAIVAEVIELKHANRPETEQGIIDVVTGKLPAVQQTGGSRKIIIGVSQNPKLTLFWKIMWMFGAITCISSTLMTYLVLGKQSMDVVLIWVNFQILWMALRVLVYHVIPPDDPLAYRQVVEQPLPSLSHDMKKRVMRLTMALSKYQVYSHPRNDISYAHDCFVASDVPPFIAQHTLVYPTDNFIGNLIQVSIKVVIGDTTLSSASWIAGSKLTPMELYDTCVVVFDMNVKSSSNSGIPTSSSNLLAIPAVRVLSGRPFGQAPDPEDAGHFAPKGNGNDGNDICWRYWIPLDLGCWLFLSTPDGSLDIRGQQTCNVMSSAEVTEQLAAGKFNIGLTRVEDVYAALELSRRSYRDLHAIFTTLNEKGKY